MRRFVFLTLKHYTSMALSSAIEALRMANRLVEREVYQWTLASLDGQGVPASNGLVMGPQVALADVGQADIVFVCGGMDVEKAVTPELLRALRRLAHAHVPLGALCTGGYALAKAGLLDNYTAVIHWGDIASMQERFPRVKFSHQLFAIYRDRYTCTTGAAPFDMMLSIIAKDLGHKSARQISELCVLDRVRDDKDRQRVPLQAFVGLFHEKLTEAASLMEANIEDPLSLDEVAALVSLSRRQVERLFRRHVGMVPSRYYLDLRLKRARALLLQTSMPIMEIAVACGFQSSQYFSQCYRNMMGRSPSAERR